MTEKAIERKAVSLSERNCRSSHFILSSGPPNSFHSLSREMVVALAALTESGGTFERWELVIHPPWVLAQCCLSHWPNLPSPGGRGSRRLGWGHGERKPVAELVVLTHVFIVAAVAATITFLLPHTLIL